MQFIVERDQILNPLARVNTVVDRKPTIPILSQVLLSVDEDGNGIRLTGSNIDIEISETIPGVQVSESGQVAFPGLTVQEFCRQQPRGCMLEFAISDGLMNVNKVAAESGEGNSEEASELSSNERYGQSHLSLPTMLQGELDGPFPILDAGEWDVEFKINRSDLRLVLQRCQHAMGQQDMRYYLNSMLIELAENEFRAVATDAHRMAVSYTEVATGLAESQRRAIVPRKTAIDMNKLLAELPSPVTVEFNDNHIRLSTPNVSFTSKLLEGTYPDWRGVIPANLQRVFRASREELTAMLRRVAILGDDVTAKMSVSDGMLRVHAETVKNSQLEIDEQMEVEQDGESIEFKVNGRYLLDIFDTMKDYDHVEFSLKNSQSACLLKFPAVESSLFVVMLLRDR